MFAVVIWIALIFGTSCTVIRPEEFFALIQRYAIADESSMSQFRIFWGVSWFAVVKGWHFTEFAILTLLSAWAIRWWRSEKGSTSAIVAAMLICTAFAASDEWHQSFVPDRFGTVTDVLIDSLGVLSAGIFLLLRNRRRQRPDNLPTVAGHGGEER